jgi:class 3 adenylate cyclase
MDWFVAHMRRSMSPGAALSFFRTIMASDVGDVLSAVRVPTLLLFGHGQRGQAEYVAARLPRAELVELPRLRGTYTWIDDDTHAESLAAIGRFVRRVSDDVQSDRVLATVLFTAIAGSTERAATLGDAGWRKLITQHHRIVRRRLAEFHGEELDVAGDGFFAAFDGPGRAIACACAIRDDLRAINVSVRAGVHTGECERIDRKLAGIAVNVGARVAAEAEPDEVLVTGTVKDLVAGSEIAFADRGERALKGVAGMWRLYAVAA